jgi:hypothetical protein
MYLGMYMYVPGYVYTYVCMYVEGRALAVRVDS